MESEVTDVLRLAGAAGDTGAQKLYPSQALESLPSLAEPSSYFSDSTNSQTGFGDTNCYGDFAVVIKKEELEENSSSSLELQTPGGRLLERPVLADTAAWEYAAPAVEVKQEHNLDADKMWGEAGASQATELLSGKAAATTWLILRAPTTTSTTIVEAAPVAAIATAVTPLPTEALETIYVKCEAPDPEDDSMEIEKASAWSEQSLESPTSAVGEAHESDNQDHKRETSWAAPALLTVKEEAPDLTRSSPEAMISDSPCSRPALNASPVTVPTLHSPDLSPDGVAKTFALPTSFNGRQMQMGSGVVIGVDIDSNAKLKRWLREFSEKNLVAWRYAWRSKKSSDTTTRYKYKCHHADFGQKGIKTTNTQCPVELTAKIAKQPVDNSLPCCIEIRGKHNHSLDSATALRELRRSAVTTEAFEEYFRQGMLPTQALRFHQLRMGLRNDVLMSADGRVNPSRYSIAKLRQRWLADQHGSFTKESIAAAVERYKEENPQHIIACDSTDGDESFAIVLVTDFMQRVHSSVKAAGEIVFIDTTSHVDESYAALTLIFCASPAGALPLGVIITSSQSKEDYTKGFQLLQRQLGQRAFYGAGYPQYIVTDDCSAQRDALAEVWPESRLLLCVFHVLQAAWRWLWNTKNCVQLQYREPLILMLKELVYAANEEEFGGIWDDYMNSSLAADNVRVTQHFETLVAKKELWSLKTWRARDLPRGHHTYNYCGNMIMVVKDVVLKRSKVYNAAALLVIMAEVYNDYLKQRLLDFSLKKNDTQNNASAIPLTAISQTGEPEKCTFEVRSSTEESVYKVDLTIGVCTCSDGSTGRACKHQVACSQYSALRLAQNFCNCSSQRRCLAVVAVGEEKVLADDLFKDFETESNCDCISNRGNGPPKAADMEQVASMMDPVPAEVDIIDSPVPGTSKATSSELDSTLELLKNTIDLLDSSEVRKGLQNFKLSLREIKTKSQMATFLRTAGNTIFNKRSLARNIESQPTSMARRKSGVSRRKAELMRGGGISKKRKRSLSKNINENKLNA